MMVEPTQKMQDNYKFLLALEEELISSMKDGK
jgi:nucleosome binding factor SPN SPT16 subunit